SNALLSWSLPAGVPIVFYAARLIVEKGILDVLEALPIVNQRYKCHLLVAGVGPLESNVELAAKSEQLAGMITWVRYLGRDDLDLAFGTCNVFVMPTYHAEG